MPFVVKANFKEGNKELAKIYKIGESYDGPNAEAHVKSGLIMDAKHMDMKDMESVEKAIAAKKMELSELVAKSEILKKKLQEQEAKLGAPALNGKK